MTSKSHIVLAATLLVIGVVGVTGQTRQEPVGKTFERLASNIVALGPAEFLHGFREPSKIPTKHRAPVLEFTRFLENGTWKSSDFLPLLAHSNPKVRTLALIALYNLEDPTVLPEIFPLVTDQSATFVSMRPFGGPYLQDAKISPEMTQPQTVGNIASSILGIYLESGGYRYGALGLHGQPGFKEYWKTHAGRATSAGWWTVRLARASHSTLPTPPYRHEAIKKLRAQIDQLPEPDHTFTLLRLKAELGADVLVLPEELIVLLKKLGPDSLLDILRRKIRSRDPDLQPTGSNNFSYASMCLFIMKNSRALLRPSDAKTLLDQEAWERDFQNQGITDPLISPWWAIGAAQLNDEEADSILKIAYARFQTQYDSEEQLELAHALWRLVGEERATTVADWIYNELANPMGLESNLLDGILRTPGRRKSILARALIEDPRFDELNWRSLAVLAKTINSLKGKETVPARELESARSPMGWDFYMRDKTKALEQHPREMGELYSTLSRWRQVLRESVSTLGSK